MTKEEIVDLLTYNVWANSRLNEVLEKIPFHLADVELQSSFKSLRLTIEHLAGAEAIWLQRIKNELSDGFPSFDKFDFPPNNWLKPSKKLLEYAESNSLETLSGDVFYQNLKGEEFNTPCFGILKHVVNHGSFHRGQIVTQLRMLGVKEIPSTDYINWLRRK
jgi:uncharacterized damage-inducible protein DinB